MINKYKINWFIYFLVIVILVFGITHSIAIFSLSLFGDTTLGILDSYSNRREGDLNGPNQSRTIFKTYHFYVNGNEYNGKAQYTSDELWGDLKDGEIRKELISYISFYPRINKPTSLVELSSLGVVGVSYYSGKILISILLILLVNGSLKKKKSEKVGIPIKYCTSCGAQTENDALYCTSCGQQTRKANTIEQNSFERFSDSGLVGFSDKYNNPEIIEAANKKRKESKGCMGMSVVVPILIFLLFGFFIDEVPMVDAIVIGTLISLAMLVINIVGIARAKKPMWEGVVVNKKNSIKTRTNKRDSTDEKRYQEFEIEIRTDSGKMKRIVERDNVNDMYLYLNIGDRVRYHPQFGTYEKYDKSKDKIIYCNVCSVMNKIKKDRCSNCNNLLFK
jgi:hypothetical protein